jgi:histidine ammonia-lyase
MGNTACIKASEILTNVEHILAIELISAAQGIDFRREIHGETAKMGRGTGPVYQLIRLQVPFISRDVYLYPLVESVKNLIHSGLVEQSIMNAFQ